MLEFIAAGIDQNDTIKVEATLDGVQVSFFVSREAIEDRLHLTGVSLAGCRDQLEENWAAFDGDLEYSVRTHGNGVTVSSLMLSL